MSFDWVRYLTLAQEQAAFLKETERGAKHGAPTRRMWNSWHLYATKR